MTASDRKRFITQVRPFDRLDEPQIARIAAALKSARFETGERLLHAGEAPAHLFIVAEGSVREADADGMIASYSPEDSFDAKSLLEGISTHSFIAEEATRCYLLPKQDFLDLTQNNPIVAGHYYATISQKLETLLEEEHNKDLASFTMARIGEAYLHPPLFVTADTSIRDAALTMKDNKATSLLVRRGDRVGIATGIDLREAVIINGQSVDAPIGDIANYNLITLAPDDFLFNALLIMTRHGISRVVVREESEILGVLEQIDLLSYFSNHSHLTAIQIERANSTEELKRASRDLLSVVRALHAKGVKVRYISELIAELNKKILNKLYTLLAPPALIENSCLLVMGSEGRNEQILKTDQDNAIILRDGVEVPELERITAAFTDALIAFGYPPCPGNIMVSNPYWSKSLQDYKQEISRWIESPNEERFMKFAIFFDAKAVAGDPGLLQELRDHLFHRLRESEVFFSHFGTPLGWFSQFRLEKHEHRDELDIKKGGIFSIVHGVRSLSLEQRISENNTLKRIEILRERDILKEDFAADLIEAFGFLSALRLKAGLEKIALGKPADNYINPKQLNKLERDLLRDSFKIVNDFKKWIAHHFRLDLVS